MHTPLGAQKGLVFVSNLRFRRVQFTKKFFEGINFLVLYLFEELTLDWEKLLLILKYQLLRLPAPAQSHTFGNASLKTLPPHHKLPKSDCGSFSKLKLSIPKNSLHPLSYMLPKPHNPSGPSLSFEHQPLWAPKILIYYTLPQSPSFLVYITSHFPNTVDWAIASLKLWTLPRRSAYPCPI